MMNWKLDTPIHEAVGEAIGAASMCWNPAPTGVFDPETANVIVEELMALLQQKLWTT